MKGSRALREKGAEESASRAVRFCAQAVKRVDLPTWRLKGLVTLIGIQTFGFMKFKASRAHGVYRV